MTPIGHESTTVPETMLPGKEQTLVSREDGVSVNQADDERSLVVCHQSFSKSLDFLSRLPLNSCFC